DRGVVGHGFVDRVVDDFVNEMVESSGRGVADVHTWAFTDVLQVAEVLKVLGGVGLAAAPWKVGVGIFVICFSVCHSMKGRGEREKGRGGDFRLSGFSPSPPLLVSPSCS